MSEPMDIDALKSLLALTDESGDMIHTFVDIKFDWRDRLRLLFHGSASISIKTITREKITYALKHNETIVYVPPVFERRAVPDVATMAAPNEQVKR
jgi:hypothetical protein